MMNTTWNQISQPLLNLIKLTALSLGALFLVSFTPASAATPDRPEEFDATAGGKFLLLDFYTPYCGTCQMMHPYVQTLPAKSGGKLVLKRVDISESHNRPYVASFGITGTPTYVLYNPSGKPVYRMQDRLSPKILEQNVLQQIQAADITSKPDGKSRAASN